MNRSDSPRLSNKVYEILKDIITSQTILDNFTAEFLDCLVSDEEIFNLNYMVNDNKHYFRGYPTGNYLKIVSKILEIWYNTGSFPINFIKIEGLKDQTASIVENLNNQTYTINFIFNFIKENNIQGAYKLVVNFLEVIGMRGVMTILGIRMSPGSFDSAIPTKDILFKSFNSIYKKKEKNNNDKTSGKFEKEWKYVTKITVGARALSKHSDRTKDTFWGNINGSELERNVLANQIFNKLITECAWINIHSLSQSTRVIEVRNVDGYGIRWTINGEFRGLIEPEESKYDKIKEKDKRKHH